MLKKKMSFLVLLLFLLGIVHLPLAHAIGVQPMVLDFEGRPGEQYQFELTISPEFQQRIVYLSLFQPSQSLDGSVTFLEGDSEVYPPIAWVRLEKERVVVPPGEPTTVSGTISVPFGAGGSYTVIVMVEPSVEDAEEGVTIIVRYAVRITINVERPGLRSDLKILDMDLVPDEEGKPLLTVRVKNPSNFRFPISGESTIRDENRRLVERVALKTPSAWESGLDSFAIYPETELLLVAPIKEPLYEGKFYLQNFLAYDTSKQVIKGQEFFIEEGQFTSLWEHFLLVEPKEMESTVQLGAAATHILQMENRHKEALHIQIGAEDIVTDYDYSVFKHLELELRGESEFTLGPRQRDRNILLIRAPRDLKPGGYYGKLNVHVFSQDDEYLETHAIPMSVLVGREWEKSAQVQSLAIEALDEEYLFSAVLLNSGNVHFSPRGTVELRDENEDLVNVIRLQMPEDARSLLPEMRGFMAAAVNREHVLPGTYLATVLVFDGEERVGLAEFPLVIEE